MILAGLLVGLAVAEVALRVVEPFSAGDLLPIPEHSRRLRRLTIGNSYIRFDRDLGWVTSERITREADGVKYRTNRAGVRADREFDASPPAGVRRLAAFGDSYTYCHEANLDDCWTAQLERKWPGTEVLNFGVPGYGPDQAWLRYQRQGPDFKSCAVLIGFMVENVNRVVNRFRPFLVPKTDLIATKPRFVLDGDRLVLLPNPAKDPDQVLDRSWVEQVVGTDDHWYFPGVLIANPLDLFQTVRVVRTTTHRYYHGGEIASMTRAYREQNEAYRIAGRVLVEFASQVRQDGATPVVLILPPASEVAGLLGGRGKTYAPLLEWLDREGVATVDTTDALVEEARRSGVSAVVENHYWPLGNQVVAQTLSSRLPGLLDQTCPTPAAGGIVP